jgi:hypothetical protein
MNKKELTDKDLVGIKGFVDIRGDIFVFSELWAVMIFF